MKSFSAKGLSVAFVSGYDSESEHMKAGVKDGRYQLVFYTPELLVGNRKWLKVLSSDAYRSKLRGFIIDEAHTVKKWYSSYMFLVLASVSNRWSCVV